jgi:hypothetical protein
MSEDKETSENPKKPFYIEPSFLIQGASFFIVSGMLFWQVKHNTQAIRDISDKIERKIEKQNESIRNLTEKVEYMRGSINGGKKESNK